MVLGGLHVTSLPEEAAAHADTIFIGPGEDTWPRFLADFRRGSPERVYRSTLRTLDGLPPIRRDLIKRRLYLVPNSIVVSRGCPHVCDFCYKEAFFEGGRSFYTQTVDAALAEIERLPGRHLYFLDDHLFGNRRFASALFEGMRGMGRLWQAAGTVNAVLAPDLLERAVKSGLRSLFVGFETLNPANLSEQRKYQNLRRDYGATIRRLHDLGVMINGSFVFGMDGDDPSVFERTVTWAVEHGIETATFHILTPYPGTALYRRMANECRLTTDNWDLYDTRHAVFRPAQMSGSDLERGYRWAYREFYRWGSIVRGAAAHDDLFAGLRHAGVLRRVEEVRTVLGRHHPDPAGRGDAASARVDPERIRQARGREPERGRASVQEQCLQMFAEGLVVDFREGMGERLQNINVVSSELLATPDQIKRELPLSPSAEEFVFRSRVVLQRILDWQDPRLFVVVGPCSIHDTAAALDYASRLHRLAPELAETMFVIMRVYFEKPRTTIGWKGLINDPDMDDSFHIEKGIRMAREVAAAPRGARAASGHRGARPDHAAVPVRARHVDCDWRAYD